MLIEAREFVGWMTRLGLYRADAPAPECDPRVWAAFFALHERLAGDLARAAVVAIPGGLGLYRDPLGDDGSYGWAPLGAISHPALPHTAAQLVALAAEILPTFASDGIAAPQIITDTFVTAGPPAPALERRFVWMRSPRARLGSGGFSGYLESLPSARRKAARQLLARFAARPDVCFDLSDRPLDERELEFVVEQLTQHWQDDARYAVAQTLWPLAVAKVRPQQALFMRASVAGRLVLLNGFVVRDEVIVSQSTCRDLTWCPDGLGVAVDLKAIEALCERSSGPRLLDPTCRTGLDDPPSIEVAKRKVVNEDAHKPILLAGALPGRLTGEYPHIDTARGWVQSDDIVRLGRGP